MAQCFLGWWHDLNQRLGEVGEGPTTQADAELLFNDNETPLTASMRVLLERIGMRSAFMATHAERDPCVGCE